MALSIKISADSLGQELQKLCDDYGKQVTAELGKTLEESGKEARQTVRDKAKKHGWKSKYINGWQYKVTHDRLGGSLVVFNGSKPGLPHLLEFSHAVRYPYGNRYAAPTTSTAKAHVKPAEEEIIEKVVSNLRRRLE